MHLQWCHESKEYVNNHSWCWERSVQEQIIMHILISGSLSVQLGLFLQAWSRLSKLTSAAAMRNSFPISDGILAFIPRPAASFFKKRPKCTLREFWILSGICQKLLNPSAGFCGKPSARRLTAGSCLLPSPIKKPNALGEMEESVRWRLTMDRRAVEAMKEGSRSDQAEMEAARSDKEGRRRLAELRSIKERCAASEDPSSRMNKKSSAPLILIQRVTCSLLVTTRSDAWYEPVFSHHTLFATR